MAWEPGAPPGFSVAASSSVVSCCGRQIGCLFTKASLLPSEKKPAQTPCDPMETTRASLSMGFSRQEYRSGLPCPAPRGLPDPGIEPMSLASPALVGGFFTTNAIWEAPASLRVPRELTSCVEVLANQPQSLLSQQLCSNSAFA